MDILGTALLDYFDGNYTEDIQTFSSLNEEDSLPLPYLFRPFEDMPKLEQLALQHCYGSVLDIGAGAGSHSLWLQNKGTDVMALDQSKGAIDVCQLRGVKKLCNQKIEDFSKEKFDTLLLLMNGIGLAGTLANLPQFLIHLKSLLKDHGQILLDSSDIVYMFDADDDGGIWVPGDVNYYGEVTLL